MEPPEQGQSVESCPVTLTSGARRQWLRPITGGTKLTPSGAKACGRRGQSSQEASGAPAEGAPGCMSPRGNPQAHDEAGLSIWAPTYTE